MAPAHDRIHRRNEPDKVDLGLYIHVETRRDVPTTDRAIPIALIITELIINAPKYAYQGRAGGIFVRFALAADDIIEIAVRDEGVSLPVGLSCAPKLASECGSYRRSSGN